MPLTEWCGPFFHELVRLHARVVSSVSAPLRSVHNRGPLDLLHPASPVRGKPLQTWSAGVFVFSGRAKKAFGRKIGRKKIKKNVFERNLVEKISLNPYKQGAEGKISCKSKKLVDQERLVLRAFFSF